MALLLLLLAIVFVYGYGFLPLIPFYGTGSVISLWVWQFAVLYVCGYLPFSPLYLY